MTFNAPSLRQLRGLGGQPLPRSNGFGAIGVHAALSATVGVYELSNPKIHAHNMSAAGDV